MSLQDRLMADLKGALRDRDETRKNAIRMALAALKNARVDKNADLTEEEMIAVLAKEVKQRRETLEGFEKVGRDDVVAAESVAIEILQSYMPRMLSEDEIAGLARKAIAKTGASGPKQMGQVMRVLMPQVQGRAEGRKVSEIVRNLLSKAAS
jgi:uncharacterized protein YqeY